MTANKTITKLGKRIKKIKACMSEDYGKKKEKIGCLEETLAKLKKSHKALKKGLEKETDEAKREKIQQNLDVVGLQRKKGLALLKSLRSEMR